MPFPTRSRASLPALSPAQMVEVDRLMIEDYGILLLQMMENAGRNLADLAQAWLGGQVIERAVLVLAGRGHNGGGGLAAARHLANRGADVQVMTAHPLDAFTGVPGQQLAALLAMGVSVTPLEEGWELPGADLLLDALIGYGLQGDPRGTRRSDPSGQQPPRADPLSGCAHRRGSGKRHPLPTRHPRRRHPDPGPAQAGLLLAPAESGGRTLSGRHQRAAGAVRRPGHRP